MTVLQAPTRAEVLAQLGEDDGVTTTLAQVQRPPFLAVVTRWDGRDGNEVFGDPPRLEFDSSAQDGGEMFRDLTVLPQHVELFVQVVNEIVADYRSIVEGQARHG
ncbi:hypothetical protein [Rhodococcus jostii]|uniref:hypothetical protein n=1 Tax=Rhodococcus jostii TaxID=132919 RepID=UPI0036393C97